MAVIAYLCIFAGISYLLNVSIKTYLHSTNDDFAILKFLSKADYKLRNGGLHINHLFAMLVAQKTSHKELLDSQYTKAYKTKDYLKVVDSMLNRTIESGLSDFLSMTQLIYLSNKSRSASIFDKLYGEKL